MRKNIILAFGLFMLYISAIAQDLPACIAQLNKKWDITTTKFNRVIYLSKNRKVYEFLVTSKLQCIHCARGTKYYDANCNLVASFITARSSSGFVADGYTEAEFGKAGYQRMSRGAKREPLPSAIAEVITKNDSLSKAGVKRIVEVKIKDKILYGFEPERNPKLANCKDCAVSIVFYNSNYEPEVTFNIGNGYTATDYTNRNMQWIIWNVN
jgi:hypothetical protein